MLGGRFAIIGPLRMRGLIHQSVTFFSGDVCFGNVTKT